MRTHNGGERERGRREGGEIERRGVRDGEIIIGYLGIGISCELGIKFQQTQCLGAAYIPKNPNFVIVSLLIWYILSVDSALDIFKKHAIQRLSRNLFLVNCEGK